MYVKVFWGFSLLAGTIHGYENHESVITKFPLGCFTCANVLLGIQRDRQVESLDW